MTGNLSQSVILKMFLETVSQNFQHLPQTEGDPSKDVNQALNVLGDSLNQQGPLKNLSRSKKKLSQKPWITTGLYKSIKNENKMYRTLVRTRFSNTRAHNHYKKYRNKLNHIMEMSKRNCYQSQLSSNSHHPRKTRKLINYLIKCKEKGLTSPDELINSANRQPTNFPTHLMIILYLLAVSWQLL